MRQPEILTNIRTSDDIAREAVYVRMTRALGYCPVGGATIQDVNQAGHLFDFVNVVSPGYIWKIEVRDGVIKMWNETLHKIYGETILDTMLDNDGKVIRFYAGDLLARFGLRTGPIDHEQIAAMPKDAAGQCLLVEGAI